MSLFGGHLKDRRNALKRYPRLFPGARKRRIEIDVMKFYGIGRHYYVRMEEEDNPLVVTIGKRLSAEDRYWKRKPGEVIEWKAWDDKEASGREEHGRFNTAAEVQPFVDETLAKWGVTDETHEWSYDDHTDEFGGRSPKWYYPDGD